MTRDLRIAVRRLAAAPLFAGFAVVSIAVGVGVTTVAYRTVDRLFFQPIGGSEPDRLVLVGTQTSVPAAFRSALQLADFEQVQSRSRSLSSVAATSITRLVVRIDGRRNELARTEFVSADYFRTVGAASVEGRIFSVSETSGGHLAVVSHDFARRHFGAVGQAIGRRIAVGAERAEIVGVLSDTYRGFPFGAVVDSTSIWVPLSMASRAPPTLSVFGRLSNATADQASSELVVLGRALDELSTTTTGGNAGRNWTARTFTEVDAARRAPLQRLGFVVQGLVVLVLLVTSTNLANLVLARGTTMRQELAVRQALGAGRWRVVREQLAESALLAAGGGLGAYLVIQSLSTSLPREVVVFANQRVAVQADISLPTLAVAGTALLLCLVVFGLEPAMHATRGPDIREQLATAATGVDPSLLRRQRMLVRWQVAVSAAFFVLAIIGIKTVFTELHHDSGVDVDQLVIAQLDIKGQQWDPFRTRRALDRVLSEARQLPSLARVELSTGLPFGTLNPQVRLSAADPEVGLNAFSGSLIASTSGFFRATGIEIVKGRVFDETDVASNRGVVILPEATARTLYRANDVVGQRLYLRMAGSNAGAALRRLEVIGVARDTDTFLYMGSARGLVAYVPLGQYDLESVTIVGRVAPNHAPPVGPLETAITRADDEIAIASIGTGAKLLRGPYGLLQAAAMLALVLGVITLGMSTVGLYGIQAVTVACRTREFGVRMSLGATASQVKGLVLRDGARPVIEGMVIGLFFGFAFRTIGRALLDAPVPMLDWWMLILVPVPLVVAAGAACYLPARRAAAVDPVVALREL